MIKNIIRRILSKFGFEIRRIEGPHARYENFLNLSRAYEYKLNETNDIIIKNDQRPKLMARLLGTPPSEAYFIVQALAHCREIKGDICEFGVAQGETSALIANEMMQDENKLLHLFDSFEGLPKPSEKDILKDDIFQLGSMEAYQGEMSCPEDMVISRLKAVGFPSKRYRIHKGFIEDVINNRGVLPQEVSFAYVDFDFYEPIKVALEFLHEVTPVGAMIVVDDYNYFSTGSKTALDEFLNEKNSGSLIYDCEIPNEEYGYFAILTRVG